MASATGGEDKREEVKTTELVTFSRLAVVSTLAKISLMLAETNTDRGRSQSTGQRPHENVRMNKRRQMCWLPEGAHRMLQVRAAVLDGRFGHQAIQFAA